MSLLNQESLWTEVLTGGDGKRLRQCTADRWGDEMPQQFCTLCGTRSLLQRTLDRMSRLAPPWQTHVVLRSSHVRIAEKHFAGRGVRLVVEPANLDTTVAICMSPKRSHGSERR